MSGLFNELTGNSGWQNPLFGCFNDLTICKSDYRVNLCLS